MGVVLNGLSHLSHVKNKAHFAMCLIRGLGGNLNEGSRENFAKEVSIVTLKVSSIKAEDKIYAKVKKNILSKL